MLVAYFGHHKCASRTLAGICRDVASLTGHNFSDITSPIVFGRNMQEIVDKNKISFLSYSNARKGKVDELSDFKGVHLIRDPRDIIVSAYFSHMYSHSTRSWKQLKAHRDILRRSSKEDGLHAEIDFSARNIESIAEWDYQQTNVLEMTFEGLVRDPFPQLLKALRFLGLINHEPPDKYTCISYSYYTGRCCLLVRSLLRIQTKVRRMTINQSELDWILRRNSFERKSRGRARGQEDTMSHYRKGVPGDWRNHFMPGHKDHFRESFGNLLVNLNYEKDNNW
jgi:hypothetical protein